MKIQGFQPTQNAASYTPSSKVSTPATSAAAAPGTSDVYSGERATRATEIMAGQDLSNISKNELKALTNKLYDAGVITGEQRLDLTAPMPINSTHRCKASPTQMRSGILLPTSVQRLMRPSVCDQTTLHLSPTWKR